MTTISHHLRRPPLLGTDSPLLLTTELIQIYNPTADYQLFVPDLAGGFRLAGSGATKQPHGSNLTWLAADVMGLGQTQLIQLYTKTDGGLGVIIYQQSDAQFVPVKIYDTFDTSAVGTWKVAHSAYGDTLVRMRSSASKLQFDVYGWNQAQGLTRLGGNEPETGSNMPTVLSWAAIPAEGLLPQIAAWEVSTAKTYGLVRWDPGQPQYTRRRALVFEDAAGVRELIAGRTVQDGQMDVILFDQDKWKIRVCKWTPIGYVLGPENSFDPAPGEDAHQPVLAGDLTGDKLTSLLLIRIGNKGTTFGAVSYIPDNGNYVDGLSNIDLGVPYRADSVWLPIDSGRNGQLAVVNCWAQSSVGIALFMPAGKGTVERAWIGPKGVYAGKTGTWLSGRLG